MALLRKYCSSLEHASARTKTICMVMEPNSRLLLWVISQLSSRQKSLIKLGLTKLWVVISYPLILEIVDCCSRRVCVHSPNAILTWWHPWDTFFSFLHIMQPRIHISHISGILHIIWIVSFVLCGFHSCEDGLSSSIANVCTSLYTSNQLHCELFLQSSFQSWLLTVGTEFTLASGRIDVW